MRRSIRFADYRTLNAAEKSDALRELSRCAMDKPNGELVLVRAEIRAFEQRYSLTSERMERMLSAGTLNENEDTASWLIALDLERRLRESEASRP